MGEEIDEVMKTRTETGLRRKTVWTWINDAGGEPVDAQHECMSVSGHSSLKHRLARFCKGQS